MTHTIMNRFLLLPKGSRAWLKNTPRSLYKQIKEVNVFVMDSKLSPAGWQVPTTIQS